MLSQWNSSNDLRYPTSDLTSSYKHEPIFQCAYEYTLVLFRTGFFGFPTTVGKSDPPSLPPSPAAWL